MPLDPPDRPDRRLFLHAGGAAAVVSLLGQGCAHGATNATLPSFASVSASLDDTVRVPAGYDWQLLYPWGAPTGVAGRMPAFAAGEPSRAETTRR